MIGFFKGLLTKLARSTGNDPYYEPYISLINKFRRVTPLSSSDLEEIGLIFYTLCHDQQYAMTKFNNILQAFNNKLENERKRLFEPKNDEFTSLLTQQPNKKDNDVSFYVNGKIIYGEVDSDEEERYFNKNNIEILNREPLKPKKCDLDCVVNECKACIEARLRREITNRIIMENKTNETKRRKVLGSTPVVSRLNEQLGCPILVGRAIADERFTVDDLNDTERDEFIRWKERVKKQRELIANNILTKDEVKGIQNMNNNTANNMNTSMFNEFKIQETVKEMQNDKQDSLMNKKIESINENTKIINETNTITEQPVSNPFKSIFGNVTDQANENIKEIERPAERPLVIPGKELTDMSTNSDIISVRPEPADKTNNQIMGNNLSIKQNEELAQNQIELPAINNPFANLQSNNLMNNETFNNPFKRKLSINTEANTNLVNVVAEPNQPVQEVANQQLQNPFNFTYQPAENVAMPADFANPFSNIQPTENGSNFSSVNIFQSGAASQNDGSNLFSNNEGTLTRRARRRR